MTTELKTDFPVTKNWVTEAWQQKSYALGTDKGIVINSVEETIKAPTKDGYSMQLLMSTMKQTKNDETQFWWGYTSQVNYKGTKADFLIIQNFVQLYGQVENKDTWFLNFLCQYNKSSPGGYGSNAAPGTAGSNYQ